MALDDPMLDNETGLARIGLPLNEPAPMHVRICAARIRRNIDAMPESTRARDFFWAMREVLGDVCYEAYWPPTIDRAQTIRDLALAVIDDLKIRDAMAQSSTSSPRR